MVSTQGKGMTPKEAAALLVRTMPVGLSDAQLEEYGITPAPERAQRISRELLTLNLFWLFAAIEAHIPQKYQSAVSELVLAAVEQGWATTYPIGTVSFVSYLEEWKERTRRYERLVRDGASPLAVSTEVAATMEELGIIDEEDRRNLLTLLIDHVPVESYGQLIENVG
jgi:hypothetical protein